MQALISICIPAYKRTAFLKRLLDSISIQTCNNFEVIVADDSPGDDVKELCSQYANLFTLFYYRNNQQLGTPENWNESIKKANGGWIKLMHDDDWFADENSLAHFAAAIQKYPAASFVFSAYKNIFLDENRQQKIFVQPVRYLFLKRNPHTLLSRNIIGPPSVLLHRNSNTFWYDKNLKWLVDIDFYIRYLQNNKPVYINQTLINVGIGAAQVTKETFGVRDVEIPENFYLLYKNGPRQLKNIFVYDAWWRLIRNLDIKSAEDISGAGYNGEIPVAISSMVQWQTKVNPVFLKKGLFSKLFMLIHYFFNYHNIR